MESFKKRIIKYNNMEKNGFKPERDFYLGGSSWHVGIVVLQKNGKFATNDNIVEFEKLMEELKW